ncbi:MAG: pre-peptidase C-terminal domain-containing protein [Planctomycetota bacterium]
MRRFLVLAFIPILLGGTAFASEVVSFTNIPVQAAPGLVSYQATLAGGYTMGALDWAGFASTIQSGTWGNELTLDLSGPLGAATFDLGTGYSYAPGAPFSGTNYSFDNAGDPAGVWTFDFYDTYDDGGDGLPDATWDYIDFTFNEWAAPQPPASTPIGVPSDTAGNLASGAVDWYSFTLGGTVDMDIWTEAGTPDPIGDTELGLYDAAGTLLANNDDGGPGGGYYSQLLQTLPAGTYYLAVAGYNASFGAMWTVNPGSADGDYMLHVVPEPASLLLLGLAGVLLRRR